MFITSMLMAAAYNSPSRKEGIDNTKPVTVRLSNMQMAVLMLVGLMEFALAVWALVLAVKCAERHGGGAGNLFIHILVALFFPIIYIIYYFVAECGSYQSK